MALADPQVARILHVERELRADQQDQPADVDPDERGEEDREARVDRDHLRRGGDDPGEHRAARRPQHARHRRRPISAARNRTRVFGTKAYRNVKTPVTNRYGPSKPSARAMVPNGSCDLSQAIELWLAIAPNRPNTTTRKIGPITIRLRYSLTRRIDRARALDVPGEVEGSLEFLDRRHDRVEQEREADRAQHVAAHVVHEGHDLLGQLAGALADRPQELVDQRLEVAVHAEALQHGEREGDERHERQQRRVDEAHRAQVQLAGQQVADQRERIAQEVEQPVRRLDRQIVPVEQQPLDAFPLPGERGHRGSVAQGRCARNWRPDRVPRCPARIPNASSA